MFDTMDLHCYSIAGYRKPLEQEVGKSLPNVENIESKIFKNFIMKNIFCTRKGFPLIIFCLLSGLAIAQNSLTVGEVRNGVGVITNPAAATAALKGGLASTAQISNLRIEWVGGTENQYYLAGNVDGANIFAKAITLHKDGVLLSAVAGPGVTITCTGVNCSKCDLIIKKGSWYCTECLENNNPPNIGHCDMASKVHVGL